MGMLTRAKKRRLEEEENLIDRISSLPDAILGEIVSLLPTKDGGRTQVLSTRWRHIWRSAPLNIDLLHCPRRQRVRFDQISGILSSHKGPGHRLSIPSRSEECSERCAAALVGWLRSPALEKLQVLEFDLICSTNTRLLASAQPFFRTLRVASFGCAFPVGKAALTLCFPVLEQLSLSSVRISECSLHALLAGCPVLQSLLLDNNDEYVRLRIVSSTIRSIGVRLRCRPLEAHQLIIEDAPCLERLLFSGLVGKMDISVISAPRLHFLGQLSKETCPRIQLNTVTFEGSHIISLSMAVRSVKAVALSYMDDFSVDAVIDFMKCFPGIEKLYVKVTKVTAAFICILSSLAITFVLQNKLDTIFVIDLAQQMGRRIAVCRKYQDLIGTLDIPVKKIVLTNYIGCRTDVCFAKFFVLHARLLESMTLEFQKPGKPSSVLIEKQRRLLQRK
ncbi:hypothetical protein PR202_gb12039 [Eleusine coracana subsp. coracana]|uniref:F-box domain-containing protein n=1 Tax=Eleusine coracana subsp. coracana TaxID=191504 RepID=A0AAV5ENP1_ELECO|nr:hypothetical protein PR202_gb12039 [Eleusine coracana subsp. coracana]